eukprot:2597147-Prymnesium_polylepis.1
MRYACERARARLALTSSGSARSSLPTPPSEWPLACQPRSVSTKSAVGLSTSTHSEFWRSMPSSPPHSSRVSQPSAPSPTPRARSTASSSV